MAYAALFKKEEYLIEKHYLPAVSSKTRLKRRAMDDKELFEL